MANNPQQKNAYYRIYNGDTQEWDIYFFKTTAQQVITNNSYAFITAGTLINSKSFSITNNGANATLTLGGEDIQSNATPVSGYPLVNISSSDDIATALGKLDHAVETVVPSGVLTTSNFATHYPDLSAIESTSGNGFLKRTGTDTWAIDNSNYISSIDGQTPSNGAVILYGDQIPYYSLTPNGNATVYSMIENLSGIVNGKRYSFVISDDANDLPSQLPTGVTGWANTLFAQQISDTDPNYPNLVIEVSTQQQPNAIYCTDYTFKFLDELKPGDSIFVKQTGVPDRWLVSVQEIGVMKKYTFAPLETQDIAWTSILNKPTTIAGYGITDASIDTSTRVITLGSSNGTPVTITVPDGNNYVPKASSSSQVTGEIYGGTSRGIARLQVDIRSVGGAVGSSGKGSLYLEQDHEKSGQYLADRIITCPNITLTSPKKYTLIIPNTDDEYVMDGTNGVTKIATQKWTQSTFARVTVDSGTTEPSYSGKKTGDIWIN